MLPGIDGIEACRQIRAFSGAYIRPRAGRQPTGAVDIGVLRRKLGDDPRAPRYVRTIRGVDYRMGDGQ